MTGFLYDAPYINLAATDNTQMYGCLDIGQSIVRSLASPSTPIRISADLPRLCNLLDYKTTVRRIPTGKDKGVCGSIPCVFSTS